jgi:hypothetical protein
MVFNASESLGNQSTSTLESMTDSETSIRYYTELKSFVTETLIPLGFLDTGTAVVFLKLYNIADQEGTIEWNSPIWKESAIILKERRLETEDVQERQANLRERLKNWFKNYEVDTFNLNKNGYCSSAEAIDEVFKYIEIEEKLVGTDLTSYILLQTLKQQFSLGKLSTKTPTTLFINEESSLIAQEDWGLEINKIPHHLRNKEYRNSYGDAFSNRSYTSPNSARPLRLIHLALYDKIRLNKSIEEFEDGEGNFSKSAVVFLAKHARRANENSLDYIDDYFPYISEKDRYDILFGVEGYLYGSHGPYSKLPNVAEKGYLNRDIIRELLIKAMNDGTYGYSKVGEFFVSMPKYFQDDVEIYRKLQKMVENQALSGFGYLGLYKDSYVALFTKWPHLKGDWFIQQIKIGCENYSKSVETLGNAGFSNLLINVDKEYYTQALELILSINSVSPHLIINQAILDLMEYKINNRLINDAVLLGIKFGMDCHEFIDCDEKNKQFKRLNVSTRHILLLTAISQGSHILFDTYKHKLFSLKTEEYSDITPTSDLFKDYYNKLVSNKELKGLFPKHLFNETSLEALRKNELGSLEVISSLIAHQLMARYDLSGIDNLENAMRFLAISSMGLNYDSIRFFELARSKNQKELLYLVSLSISHSTADLSIFSPQVISKLLNAFNNVKGKYKISEFTRDLRNAIELSKNHDRLIKAFEKLTRDINEIDDTTLLQNIERLLRSRINKEFSRFFGLANDDKDRTEKLYALQGRWGGNIEPIITAAARFYSIRNGQELTETLREVVYAELENRFLDYKYRSTGNRSEVQAIAQLEHLSEEQRIGWTKNHAEVFILRRNEETNSANREANIKAVVQNFLELGFKQKHFHSTAGIDDITFSSMKISVLMGLLSEIDFTKRDVQTQISKAITKFGSLGTGAKHYKYSSAVKALKVILESHDDDEKKLDIARELAVNIRNDFNGFLANTDFKNDLDRLILNLKQPKNNQSRNSLVFTTTTDSLRILLDIGDIVQAGSCQSLKRGFIFETVLAPAIDANTKAVVSFMVNEEELHTNPHKSQRLMDQVDQGLVDYEFDHNKLSLILKLKSNGQVIKQINFTRGFARKIIRTGHTFTEQGIEPALMDEQTYRIAYEDEVEKSLERVIEMVGLPRSKNGRGIMIKGTRNPGGVYVDSLSGTRTGDYSTF